MKLDNMDRLSELEITLKQTRAILNSFTENFVNQTEKDVLIQIQAQFETYCYTASVITDLVCKAVDQAETLDSELQKEKIKAV